MLYAISLIYFVLGILPQKLLANRPISPQVANVTQRNATDFPFFPDDETDMMNDMDATRCPQYKDSVLLDNIVGLGWDNLRNLPMAEVFRPTLALCQTTADGEYLIPDNVLALEVKESQLDNMASFYGSYQDHIRATGSSVNTEVSATMPSVPVTIGGSFSYENQESKKTSMSTESSILRTSLKYHGYNFVLDIVKSYFNYELYNRLIEVGQAIEYNQTKVALYLSELIIRDYGTHVITRAKVGAELIKEDYVNRATMLDAQSSMTDIKASASASFKDTVSVKVGGGKKKEDRATDTYSSSLRHSNIKSKGSLSVLKLMQAAKKLAKLYPDPKPAVNPNDTADDPAVRNKRQALFPASNRAASPNYTFPSHTVYEEKDIWDEFPTGGSKLKRVDSDEVVALDRSGEPLYHMINKYTLPDAPDDTADAIAFFVKQATIEYFDENTRDGCMDPKSKGFDFKANKGNDSLCAERLHNYSLGGFFYYTNTSDEKKFKPPLSEYLINGLSGGFFCPPGYSAVLLSREGSRIPNPQEGEYYIRTLYACHSEKAQPRQGYMFGGFYSSSLPNPFTGSQSCPGRYLPIRLFHNVTVCVSLNYDMDSMYSMDYGGIMTCQSLSKACPPGFTSYLAATYFTAPIEKKRRDNFGSGCEFNFCVRASQIPEHELMAIKMPPYVTLMDEDITTLRPIKTTKPITKTTKPITKTTPSTTKKPPTTTTRQG